MLPNGWSDAELGTLVDRPIAYGVLKPESAVDGIPMIRINNVSASGGLNAHDLMRITAMQSEEYRRTRLREGDLILSVVGTIGRIFEVPASLSGANLSRAFCVIGIADPVTRSFVQHILRGEAAQEWMHNLVIGNAQKVLNLGVLRTLSVPLPPREEQRRISAVLDVWDTAIATAERLLDLRHKLERRTFTALSRLWETVAIAEVGRLVGGGTPSKAKPDFWGGPIPWVSSKDMVGWEISGTEDGITETAIRESTTRLVPAGSVLMVVRSGILRHTVPVTLAMRPVTINQDIKALLLSPPYRGALIGRILVLENERLRGATVKTGTTVESIDIAALKEFEIPYPGSSEAEATEALLLDLRLEHEIAAKRVSRLRLQKRGLMQQLLTGKLRVPESIDALLPPAPRLVAAA